MYSFHGLVLQSHSEKNRLVPSFLRHECHQILGTNMDEGLKSKGKQRYTRSCKVTLHELAEEEPCNDSLVEHVENLPVLDAEH